MDYTELFLDGKIYIHISKDQADLINDLQSLMPELRFRSGDKLYDVIVYDLFKTENEAWIKNNHGGVTYARTAPNDVLNIPAINISDVLNDSFAINITEDELMDLWQ